MLCFWRTWWITHTKCTFECFIVHCRLTLKTYLQFIHYRAYLNIFASNVVYSPVTSPASLEDRVYCLFNEAVYGRWNLLKECESMNRRPSFGAEQAPSRKNASADWTQWLRSSFAQLMKSQDIPEYFLSRRHLFWWSVGQIEKGHNVKNHSIIHCYHRLIGAC